MRYKHNGCIINAIMKAFCFWECGAIGFNLVDDQGRFLNGYDIPISEAKVLYGQLGAAIQQFDAMESTLEEYIEELNVNSETSKREN